LEGLNYENFSDEEEIWVIQRYVAVQTFLNLSLIHALAPKNVIFPPPTLLERVCTRDSPRSVHTQTDEVNTCEI
jgi:hypothetical protein